MNLHTLNDYMDLTKKRAKAIEMLEMLRLSAIPASPALTGMPHASGVKDKVGDLAIELNDLGARVDYYDEKISELSKPVRKFIENISDDRTRIVFRLRFLRGLSWPEIANVLGIESEDAVKKVCYRYFGDERKQS